MRRGSLLVAVWSIPVIIGTGGHYFGLMMGREGMPAYHIVGHSLAMWYVWIPATPLIFGAQRHFASRIAGWPRTIATHLAIISAVFLGQTWLTLIVGHATGHVPAHVTFGANFTALVINLLLYDILIYVGVIAVATGIDYARRYRDRDLRASQLETQLERARLEALHSQLQPHFLFNALNSVAMLIRRDRKEEALDVLIGFGELLRYVLDEAGTIDVLLGEELRFVRRYLEIEQVRHRERLRVDFEVEPAAERAIVPNLVLQPFVENALKHGIAHLPAGGCVRVEATRVGATLRLAVANDGPPLPPDFAVERTSGVGIRNARERLAAISGGDARLTIAPIAPTGGTRVTIEMPFHENPRPALERTG